MTTGEKIAEQRRLHKMSRAELADKVGVTRSVIIKWESDLYCPAPVNAEKLSDLFGVPFCYFFDDCSCPPECANNPALEAACVLREKNAEVALALKRHCRNSFLHKKRAVIALLAVLCALSLFVTVCIGIIVFPLPPKDVSVYATTAFVTLPHFIMSVAVTLILAAALFIAIFKWKDNSGVRSLNFENDI